MASRMNWTKVRNGTKKVSAQKAKESAMKVVGPGVRGNRKMKPR